MNLDENRAVCDSLIVKAPNIVNVNIVATISSYDTVNYTSVTAQTAISNALYAYIKTVPID
jgi:hypothetical protein